MIENFVKRASVFQSPSDLGALLEEHRASISKHDMFNKPKHQVLVDVWMAAMLGLGFRRALRTHVEVCICGKERFPDFRVRYGDHELAFEGTVTTLDTPEGKPGVVYRGDRSLGPITSGKRIESPPFDPRPLKDAVRKKVAKNYASRVHLCVYLTTGAKSITFDDVVEAVVDAGGAKFESVWILTETHMTCAKVSERIGGPDGWVPIPVKPIEEEES